MLPTSFGAITTVRRLPTDSSTHQSGMQVPEWTCSVLLLPTLGLSAQQQRFAGTQHCFGSLPCSVLLFPQAAQQ